MTIVHDTIAAELATLTRQQPTPVAPYGYGTDLRCVDDVREDLAEVDPFSTLAIGEALARRLMTPRGQLLDDPEYGYDIRGLLNRGADAATLRDMASPIRNEVTKDDRVADATVTVTAVGTQLTVQIQVTPADTEAEPFALTLGVVNGELMIEELS